MPAATAWMPTMSLQRKHRCYRLPTEVCDLLFSSWAVWKPCPVSPRGKAATPSSFPPAKFSQVGTEWRLKYR